MLFTAFFYGFDESKKLQENISTLTNEIERLVLVSETYTYDKSVIQIVNKKIQTKYSELEILKERLKYISENSQVIEWLNQVE